ncbi:MAG: hypothetical protein EOP49_08240, partial [Sphingobacteriales bacterium]
MKRIFQYVLMAGLLVPGAGLLAQKAKEDGKKKAAESRPPQHVAAYLGNSQIREGRVSKKVFDSLIRQGVRAMDSSGKTYTVEGFTFNYGERNLYEDSVGRLMILTDFVSEYCPGDTLTQGLTKNILQRTKAGDTAIIDQI